MSRSYRKNPHTGITTIESDKPWKVTAHRRVRQAVRQALDAAYDFDAMILPDEDEVMTEWDMGKDGKQRFDPAEFPNLLRK